MKKVRLFCLLKYKHGNIIKIVKQDVLSVEKESAALKLEKAKEEGMLLGQKQQRGFHGEEVKRMEDLLKEYKIRSDRLNEAVKELEGENTDLKKYNEKANNEIKTLVGMLKKEQEKQKQLSSDLESLTDEIKRHRFDATGTSVNY